MRSLSILAILALTACNPVTASTSEGDAAATPKQTATATAMPVELTSYKPIKAGFGNVMIVTLELKNPNDFAVKDILVKCSARAPSGTTISQNEKVVFQRIGAHKHITVRRMNFGFIDPQSSNVICQVERAVGPAD